MQRRDFLGTLAVAGTALPLMSARTILKELGVGPRSSRMPSIFIGHGSPMNAVADNSFTRHLAALGQRLERPKAILLVSAHWLTRKETFVSLNPAPPTIHDLGGFPDELFAIRYPAPGAPDAAAQVVDAVQSVRVHADHDMGLDHGAWTILRHIYPDADVPVFQLSINWDLSTAQHYALAQELRGLRDHGILIMGSGNVVHNLGRLDWQGGEEAPPASWALEFDAFVDGNLAKGDHKALVEYDRLGALARTAHPTNDHYLPLLYTIGASHAEEHVNTIHTGMSMGSISMRSFEIS